MIEIITVVTILVAMMGITFPLMRSVNDKNKLRATARELVSLMKYARTEAIFGERTTEVFLDVNKREYWLDLREPDPKTGDYNPKAKKSQLEQKRSLNKQIKFDEVSAYDSNIIKDQLIAVDFFADGSATPAMMTLMHERGGAKMTIEVMKSTGMTEITAGSIADKKAKTDQERASNPAYTGGTGVTQ